MTGHRQDHWPEGVARTLPPPTGTLDDALRRTVARCPDKTAIIFQGARQTYAALDAAVTRLAGWLQSACGLGAGERVGLFMQNAPQFVVAFYAIIRAGAVVVPINAMQRSAELGHICADAGIRTLVAGQDLAGAVAPLVASGALARVILTRASGDSAPGHSGDAGAPLPDWATDWADAMASAAPFHPVAMTTGDACIQPYTSGSTGQGKGCVHTHASTLHALGCITAWFGYTGDEVHLGAAPLFHIVGIQGIMNAAMITGGTVVIMPRWDRTAAARLIAQHRVTTWFTVPTAVIDLLNADGFDPADLASLQVLQGGGAAMPEAVARRLHELTGLRFVEVYGMTETMGPVTHNPPRNPRIGSLGIPIQNTRLLIVDPETMAPVPPGTVGEIVVSGPQIMQGYWNNPAADAEAFVTIDGARFLRTGDLARADADGFVHIVDRLKRMINASGYKVWPAEVEALLYRHPAIAEACVIRARDPYRGETVKAVVALRPGATLDAAGLTLWAQGHMAAYKVPRQLEIVDALPKSAAGKVLWRVLQDRQAALDAG